LNFGRAESCIVIGREKTALQKRCFFPEVAWLGLSVDRTPCKEYHSNLKR